MSLVSIIAVLAGLLVLAVAAGLALWWGRRRASRRLAELNEELLEASKDASVGRRLMVPDEPDAARLVGTINRLFDALDEREEKIRGRDRLFTDFAKTLPEIVIVHDEKILFANGATAGLIGLDPSQLAGREVVDLVKPA